MHQLISNLMLLCCSKIAFTVNKQTDYAENCFLSCGVLETLHLELTFHGFV